MGEDTLLICDYCGYSANRQIATFRKPKASGVAPAPLQEVHTPNVTTIASLADFLKIGLDETAKAVFMVAELEETQQKSYEKFVFVVVRGDMEVNETKLSNAINAKRMRPATTDEIRAIGAEPGYGSPLGIDRSRVLLVVDDLVTTSPNLVAGANRIDTHLRNVTYGRDYTADVVTDVVAVSEGYACPVCGNPSADSPPGSRWAISLSWAPSTASPWAPPSWTKMAKASRLSWVPMASAPSA